MGPLVAGRGGRTVQLLRTQGARTELVDNVLSPDEVARLAKPGLWELDRDRVGMGSSLRARYPALETVLVFGVIGDRAGGWRIRTLPER